MARDGLRLVPGFVDVEKISEVIEAAKKTNQQRKGISSATSFFLHCIVLPRVTDAPSES